MLWRCALTAVLATAFCSVSVAAPGVKAGIEAWQRADYAAAVAIWRPLAEAGDADAAFNLGQAYRLGRGIPVDLVTAETWFERAARKGHVDAQTTLGLLLFDAGNRVGGLRWLKSAAEQGEPRALLIYGTALFNGDAVVRDPVLAYAYVSRAAAQGLAPAKTTLAEMDQILPLEQRKKAVALALVKAKPITEARSAAKFKPTAKPERSAAIKPPAPEKPASVAKSATAPTGAWRVQLGAFAKRGSAEALFKKLASSGVLAARQPFYIATGPMTRLQVGPYESRAAASAACIALSAKSLPCFPVRTK